ncbi:transglycosylase SLT domain-containing protein [Nonomuraea sp. NPDC050328]|uniref:aggregation-promoting factor C-terminal-like domain-containing protein n=1 Tax=Nonomuraea sp. NPDC050328 TaxID=3364361 RepID=UPI0037B54D18
MNSKSALCGTFAVVAFTCASTATAAADTETGTAADSGPGTVIVRATAEAAHDKPGATRTWRTDAGPAEHVGSWRTSVRPKTPVRRPGKDTNKRIARDMLQQRAWSFQEFRCLDSLWTRESNWNHRAQNPSSGAYGIPQALPAGKMSGAGRDWRHNPATQIRWGLRYIKDRYGRPCGAWGHFRSHNWY